MVMMKMTVKQLMLSSQISAHPLEEKTLSSSSNPYINVFIIMKE